MPVPHPRRPYPLLIVNVALAGMIPRRAQVPHVPVSAEAIVEDAVACRAAGASIVHVPAHEVRTGLEDNPWWDHATREPATNAGLVQRVAALAELAGRRVATPEEARELLGLAVVPSA